MITTIFNSSGKSLGNYTNSGNCFYFGKITLRKYGFLPKAGVGPIIFELDDKEFNDEIERFYGSEAVPLADKLIVFVCMNCNSYFREKDLPLFENALFKLSLKKESTLDYKKTLQLLTILRDLLIKEKECYTQLDNSQIDLNNHKCADTEDLWDTKMKAEVKDLLKIPRKI
jgi:hypothetical protein